VLSVFSCPALPRGNNPGGIITISAGGCRQQRAWPSLKEALVGYSRIIYKIMSSGTQVSPGHAAVGRVPDWGPETADVADTWTCGVGTACRDNAHDVGGWSVADKTLVELYLIWLETGALDMIAEVDRGLHSILLELMEERLEEEGIQP